MNIIATERNLSAKVSQIRKSGQVPAELYGHGTTNMHLAVGALDLKRLYKAAGGNTVVTLEIGGKKYPVIIHDIQRDFATNELSHVDFYQVRMDEKMKVAVPVELTGEAPAVRTGEGVLNKSLAEIEIEALPADIPHSFIIDLSSLTEVGSSIYVKDLAVQKGVSVLADGETVVVSIAALRAEEVVTSPVGDVSTVKVESEEKKEERAAKKEETK